MFRWMMIVAICAVGEIGARAEDAPPPPVTKDTVFTLKKTPASVQAIVSQRGVEDAAQLLSGKPVQLQPGEVSAELILDFGREIVGTVRMSVRAEAPSNLEVYYGEALQEARKDNEYTTRWYKRPKDFHKVQAGQQTLVNQGRRAFRYMRLLVPKGASAITLEGVEATLQHYPVNEAGAFSCSDPQLNKIWEISAYATKLCMQQYYEDGIKRDGLLWISDYRVQYLCNALLYGDRDLARKSLFLMAASQSPDGSIPAQASRGGASQHPSNINYMPGIPRGVAGWTLVNYCLDYIGCLRDYYTHTGDKEALIQLWPAVQKLVPYLVKQNPRSLNQLANFITDGRYKESWWGSHCVLEMQFLIGMQDALYLAQVVGDETVRQQCETYLPGQRLRIEDFYFDKDLGLYFDESNNRQSTSWHANAFSALAGVGDYRTVAEKLQQAKDLKVRPATAGYMLYWTLEAKFRAGLTTPALNDVRKIWGHMLKYGATTTWEKVDLDVEDHPDENDCAGSRCHGWSAGPAYFFPAHILGVQPKEPGFSSVRIEPQLGDLQWAEGVIPTPKGLIRVRWEGGAALTGTVTLPENMTGEAKVGDRTIPLKPGVNEIKAQQSCDSPLPGDCPFPRSLEFSGIELTGRHAQYGNADTWYPSWASDGDLYSPWTDGYLLSGDESRQQVPFDETHPDYPCNSCDFLGRKTATAQAKIVGDDPLQLKIVNLPPRIEAPPAPYEGRYPCGSLIHDGVWYYGTYALTNNKKSDCAGVGWTLLGPFVGFRWSKDLGKTWTETPCTPAEPLFGENPKHNPVKIGAPHFVDFGRNMEHSPDGHAYLVAHGSTRGEAWNNWIQGDQVYLLRVKPSIKTMNDATAYEFFAGRDAGGSPIWTKNFADIKPLLEWNDNLGCVTATYNPGLKKYLMCISRSMRVGQANVLFLEAAQLAGPWKVVAYLKDFGPENYFLNIPSKFISQDGRTFWLCHSGNWSGHVETGGSPPGSHYALCLREIKLLSPTDPPRFPGAK